MNLKLFLFFISLLFLTSCDKDVNCSGKDEIKVFYDLLSEDFEKIYIKNAENRNPDFNLDLPFEEVKNDFFAEAVKLEGIRPVKIEKEISKCECEAQLSSYIPEDLINYLEENMSLDYDFDIEKIREQYIWKNVKYSFQYTEDNMIYCEIQNNVRLSQAFLDYAIFKNLIYKYKNKDESLDNTDLTENSVLKDNVLHKYIGNSEDCSYEITFRISSDNNVSGFFKQDCYNNQGQGERVFKGNFTDGVIKANIENKEFFEMEFENDVMKYYLLKIVDNGYENNFDRDNPLIYTKD